MKTKEPTVQGVITEILSGGRYRVQVDGSLIIGYTSGKMKMHKIHVMLGDHVDVILDPYGGNATNRIVRRL